MIEIEYDSEEEDLVAFIGHHVRNAPAAKSAVNRSRWISTLVFLVFAVGAAAISFPLAVAYAAVAAVFFLLWPRYSRWRWQRGNIRQYRSGRNLATFGRTRLRLDKDGISSSNPFSTSTYRLSAIERIEQNPSHTFIYVGAMMAIAIPRQKVCSANYDMFLEELVRLRSAAVVDGNSSSPPGMES